MIFQEIIEIFFVILMIILGLIVLVLDVIDKFSRDIESEVEFEDKEDDGKDPMLCFVCDRN